MASPQFDFPEPLGPVMAVKPRPKGMVTSPRKDLKFSTSSDFRYISIPQRRRFCIPTTLRHACSRVLKNANKRGCVKRLQTKAADAGGRQKTPNSLQRLQPPPWQ